MTRVTILDGGMGQCLVKRSTLPITPLWSAQVMLQEPELVQRVHLEFIQAGAQVITLNTYTATPQRLARDADISLLEPLHHGAAAAALAAKNQALSSNVRVAGCLPPLVASYHPELAPSRTQSMASYQQLVDLQNPAADLFICETMSSSQEAYAACKAAKSSGKPVWVAFSVADDGTQRLRGKEPLAMAIETIMPLQPDAILLNCSRPESVSHCLPVLAQRLRGSPIQFGAYANGFSAIDALNPGGTVQQLQDRIDLNPVQYAAFATDWVNQGASIVGGCCEITPTHIAAMVDALTVDAFFQARPPTEDSDYK